MSDLRLSADAIAKARVRWDVIFAEVPMRQRGREFVGLCPFHAEKSPSFCVVPEKGFFKCFGCGAYGDAIDFEMRRLGLGFTAAVHELNGTAPLAARRGMVRTISPRAETDNREEVEAILRGSGPIHPQTAAHLYLWMRGLVTPSPGTKKWIANLLAHPSLYCTEIQRALPAMVAPIEGSRGVTAVQRVWVMGSVECSGDGPPKDNRASLKIRKKTLGRMLDGAVRLRPAKERLGLAEGIETAIAAGLLNGMPVWATCGASRLGSIALPEVVREVWVFGDNGPTGEELAYRAAELYCQRGLDAQVCFPPVRADDFNTELLLAEARR